MSRINTRRHQVQPPVARATSPIATVSATPDTRTFEGAPGFSRTTQAELFLLATGAFSGGEGTFYEDGKDRDNRLRALTRRIAREDPQWGLEFARWLRTEGNIRTGALMFACEFVRERLEFLKEQGHTYVDPHRGINRAIIRAVCRRADEPGEILAIWTGWNGKQIPKPVKRGVGDAIQHLYNQRSLLKYDTATKGYRFGDVLNLVHARPRPLVTEGETDGPTANPKTLRYNPDTQQGALFQYALDRRHNPDTAVAPDTLGLLNSHHALTALPVGERRAVITAADGAERLAWAGFTWEMLAGWLQGPMDKDAWEAIIPSMGIMALVRNLRNFDQAGVSDKVAQQVIDQLTDPAVIAKSKMFPFRFLAAYQNAPSLRWSYPLEQALGHSLANVPALGGRTLILIDRSGSMFYSRLSERSELNRADGAAIFGAGLAVRAESADLVQFGTTSSQVTYEKSDSILKIMERFTNLGGTNTATAARKYYAGHDRVVIITDEQAHDGDPGDQVPAHVPVYTWNLGGYKVAHGRSGSNARFTLGGLTDKAFTLIPLLEAGTQGAWPWHVSHGS